MPTQTPRTASVHSRSNTINSIGNQIGYKVRNMAHYGQPTIDIHVDGHEGRNAFVTSYSTMDTIKGHVSIYAAHDIRFEDIDIAFTGTSQVFVDRLTTTPTVSGRTEAAHRFLLLRQPLLEEEFPSPRIFEAGKTYRFPFTFTVPSQLLPKACQRSVVSDHVRAMHLQLPPSLGDPDLAGFGTTLLDDLAPEMAKITYGIKVKVAHIRGTEGMQILAEKMKKLRVKPAFEEQPPLNIDNNPEYRSRQEKVVKKGLFKGKLGTLAAKTVQPKPLVIPGARTSDNPTITTMAKLVLRFDPADDANAPPKLGSLNTKLKVTTYYASSPRTNFPARSSLGFDVNQGVYPETVHLSTLCIGSAAWEKHAPGTPIPLADPTQRRDSGDSGISDCSTASLRDTDAAFAAGLLTPTKGYQGGTFYTTQILVPITLPDNKNFLPTFHSCLVSRVYTLGLTFSPSGGSSLNVKVPIQICAHGSQSGIENARARSVEETVLREAAAVFSPRSVAPPPDWEPRRSASVTDEQPPEWEPRRSESLGGTQRDDAPPDYAAFAPSRTGYSQRNSIVVARSG